MRVCLWVALLGVLASGSAEFTDDDDVSEESAGDCVLELGCAACRPEHPPLVTSHRAAAGAVRVRAGERARLECRGGRFLAYPLRDTLDVTCAGGRLRVAHDQQTRHLFDLGCQENIFEDVLHETAHCAAPLQGRAWLVAAGGGGGARHLAALCYDADAGAAARASLAAGGGAGAAGAGGGGARHSDRSAPLSVLGNFQHMFDASTRARAARLFGDPADMTRRLQQLLRPDRVALAAQELAVGKLLAPQYFDDQIAAVTDFESNMVPVWRSVAEGNLAHAQRDAARRRAAGGAAVALHAGTHGVASARAGAGRTPLALLPGGRFPLPRLLWTVLHDERAHKALAIVVLNDPFVAVSEIRAALACESLCARVAWLAALRRARRWETPLLGLTVCCAVHEFADRVPEFPRALVRDVPPGPAGLLLD